MCGTVSFTRKGMWPSMSGVAEVDFYLPAARSSSIAGNR